MDMDAFPLYRASPLVRLRTFIRSRASCGLSGPFSQQGRIDDENQYVVTFFEKMQFFPILISEF